MIPPMLQRPPDTVPSTGPAKASDAFQRRESSAETKNREGSSKKAAMLQQEIAALTRNLTTEEADLGDQSANPFNPMGGRTSGRVKLSNDQYNNNRERLIKAEEELKKLQGGPSQGQASQAVQVGRFKVSSN